MMGPVMVYSLSSVIDNPWGVCLKRASEAGKLLAEVLVARQHVRIDLTAFACLSCLPPSSSWRSLYRRLNIVPAQGVFNPQSTENKDIFLLILAVVKRGQWINLG